MIDHLAPVAAEMHATFAGCILNILNATNATSIILYHYTDVWNDGDACQSHSGYVIEDDYLKFEIFVPLSALAEANLQPYSTVLKYLAKFIPALYKDNRAVCFTRKDGLIQTKSIYYNPSAD